MVIWWDLVDLSCIDGDLTMKNGELMIYFAGIEWGEEFGEQDRKIYGKISTQSWVNGE